MTYVSANRRPNPAALAGALGIPTAFGALLVVGLAVTVVTAPPEPRIKGEIITETPLPPPPPPTPTPETPRDAKTATTTTTTTPTPTPPTPFPVELGKGETVNTFPTGGETVTTGPIEFGSGSFGPGPSPSPASLYDAVGAKPKGNQGKWVTNDDYRPRWIAEELSGTARFTLQIDARGKVTGCSITRSTGHAALDGATCDLVSKRARFDAARDGNGKAVAGSYTGSVTWKIP